MTEYIIAGQKIKISTELENERLLLQSTLKQFQQINPIFDKWYTNQTNINSITNTCDKVLENAIDPIIDVGIGMFNANGLYTIDRDLFWEIHSDIRDPFFSAVSDIVDQIDKINAEAQGEKYQRKVNKANRGRVVGGGFGMEGAIKGMVSAGAINATTGMAYSIFNSIGNMGTSIAAGINKDNVIRNAKEPLRESLMESAIQTIAAIRDTLREELNKSFKITTGADMDHAQAIMSHYKQGRIPASQKTTQILNALLLNPYAADIYDTIWNDYGDKNGDLIKLSEFFGDTLKERIAAKAARFGEETYSKYCSDYENAFNKPLAAVRCEKQIKQALDILKKYCSTHNIPADMIPQIKRCQQLLKDSDLYQRTVHGTVYDTRELAADVKKDYDTFFALLSNQDIKDKEICQKIRTENYLTDEFKSKIESLLKEERSLRNPGKIFENITKFVRKGLGSDIMNAGWIDVPNQLGDFSQRKDTVCSLTTMQEEEVPLILFARAANGKSGVLLTNLSVHVYAKGLLSNENAVYPIELVENIECYEKDKYIISQKGKENGSFVMKQKLSTEEQIALGEVMAKLVHLINNIPSKFQKQLYRTIYGTITCICGTRLLPSERVCPICHRLVLEKGEIVESQCCPGCGSLIPVNKKFCSMCGFRLIENSSQQNIIPTSEISQQETSIEASSSVSMENRCKNCNSIVKPGKKFCPSCGNKIVN